MSEPTSGPKGKRQPSAVFMKPVPPDEKLAAVIGNAPPSRTEVTRNHLWEYIRGHSLQAPESKTFIKADDQLKEAFDAKERVSMFEMAKLVFGHVK